MMLPLVKLGTLALRTLSKPIASRLKQQAAIHPKFRRFIINLAQINHRFSTTIQRSIHSQATNVAIRPLNEERAVQSAGDLLGELFVFAVAGAAIIFEVQRNARSEAKKEEFRKKEFQAMTEREEELAREVEKLKQKFKEIEQLAMKRGLVGVVHFRQGQTPEGKSAAAA